MIAFATMIITVYFAIKLAPKLAIIAIICFPINLLISNLLSKSTRKYILHGKYLKDNYFSIVQETLIGIQEIKCLTAQRKVFNIYKIILEKILKNNIKLTTLKTIINVISSLISSSSEWIILLYASWLIITDNITIGILVSFNSFMSKFNESISKITEFNIYIQSIFLSLKRINELLILSDELELENNYKPIIKGSMEIILIILI